MPASVQLTFRDMDSSPAIAAHVDRRAAKLDTFFDRLTSCHVVVEAPHRHSKHGSKFHVRIDMHVPGKELVISKNANDLKDDLHAVLDDAFGDAERVLESHARHARGDVRHHERPPHGVIAKVFHDRGYGFIEAEGDGHEVYFHQNSVLDAKFERLSPGMKVWFAEEDGDKGPQASTVHVSG